MFKDSNKLFEAILVCGFFGLVLFLVISTIVLSIYGLYLAWCASIILFVLVILIEPTPLIFGILAVFGHPEVAQKFATFLGL